MLSPREVIDDIRRGYGVDAPNGIHPGYKMAARLLSAVTIEQYKSRNHFFMELIQNADDTRYTTDVIPTLRVVLKQDSGRIVISSNEIGFNEEDVRAISKAAESTKTNKKDQTIGEKGLGFKAVFLASDRPEIHSNGYHFRFDKNKYYENLGMVIPEWIDGSQMNEGTKIVLPLQSDYQPPDFTKDLQPEMLLFLRRLRRIDLRDCPVGKSVVLQREDNGSTVKVVRTHNNEGAPKPTCHKYHRSFRVHRKSVPMGDIQEEKRLHIEATDVAVALPLNQDHSVYAEQSWELFAFLPVKRSDFRFVAHADFVLTTSREEIQDLAWNKRLRDSLGDCLAEAILECRSASPPGATALRVLTDPKKVSDPFLREVVERAIALLKDAECVPTIDGKWVRPCDAIIPDRDGLWRLVSEADASSILSKVYVDYRVQGISDALRLLDVSKFSLNTLLECLQSAKWQSERPPEWFGHLFGLLGKLQLTERQIGSLRDSPILLLQTGETVTPASASVFHSLGGQSRYGFESQLNLLHNEALGSVPKEHREGAEDLLGKLGVSKASPTVVIEKHILPLHSGSGWSDCSDDTLIGHAHYIRDHFSAYLGNKHDYEKKSAKDGLVAKLKVITSAESVGVKHLTLRGLYLGSAYGDPNCLEKIFGDSIKDLRISREYLARGNPNDHAASEKAWKELFIELGAWTYPRVCMNGDNSDYEWAPEVITLIQSNNAELRNQFLRIINEYWDSHYTQWAKRPGCGPTQPSQLLRSLQTMEVPTTAGVRKLRECYRKCEDNQAVFGDAVPYLEFELSPGFSDAVGIIRTPTVEHALETLDRIRNTPQDAASVVSSVERLYKFLESRFEPHSGQIKKAFATNSITLADTADGLVWKTTAACCWSLPKDLRPFSLVARLSRWRELQSFFCDKLGVDKDLTPDSLVDTLVQVSGANLPHDDTTRITQEIYKSLRGPARSQKDGAAWSQRLREQPLIWSKGYVWSRCDGDVFAADDPGIERLFHGSSSVKFVHLPPEELTSHKDLLRLLRIRTLSESIKIGVPDDLQASAWPGFKKLLAERLRLIARFLCHKHTDIFKKAVEQRKFDLLSTLGVHRCTPLELDVTLSSESARHPFKARLIENQGRHNLFVDASSDSYYLSIGIEIGRLFGLTDDESTLFERLLGCEELAGAEVYLETLRVPVLPQDEEHELFGGGNDDSQMPPDDDVTQTGPDHGHTGVSPRHACPPSGEQTPVVDSPVVVEISEGGMAANHLTQGHPDAAVRQSKPIHHEIEPTEQSSVNDRPEPANASGSTPGLSSPIQDHGAEGDAFDHDTFVDRSDVGNSQESSAESDSGLRSGSLGEQLVQSGGSHSPRDGTEGNRPTKPDAPDRTRTPRPASGSANERMRSYVTKEREPGDGERDSTAKEKRERIEAAAIRHVIDWERHQNRNPTDENANNPQNEGYDLTSRGLNGNIERYIEVKGVKGDWGLRGVAVTPAQFAFAEEKGDLAWLYVVEFALSDAPRIYRIQDFARRVWRFGFDDGWRNIAES